MNRTEAIAAMKEGNLPIDFWQYHLNMDKVLPLKNPCKDCAVENGFYSAFSVELSKETKSIQDTVCDTWFCHNNCNRGCAGIRKYLLTINTQP